MLKTLEKLINSDTDIKLGNHRREAQADGSIKYFYYNTAICQVWHSFRLFKTDNGGYATRSTSRAIGDYERYFRDKLGYTDTTEKGCLNEKR